VLAKTNCEDGLTHIDNSAFRMLASLKMAFWSPMISGSGLHSSIARQSITSWLKRLFTDCEPVTNIAVIVSGSTRIMERHVASTGT
jgi:hypothetical protein